VATRTCQAGLRTLGGRTLIGASSPTVPSDAIPHWTGLAMYHHGLSDTFPWLCVVPERQRAAGRHRSI
jgi:hypothetical protein